PQLLGHFLQAHAVGFEQHHGVVEQIGGLVRDLIAFSAQRGGDQLGGLLAHLLVPQRLVGEELRGVRPRRRGLLARFEDPFEGRQRLARRGWSLLERVEEAGLRPRVTRGTRRIDAHQHRILIAVELHGLDPLRVAAGLALHPELIAAAAPEGRLASRERLVERLAVHPGEHQHLAGGGILHDRRHQAVLIEFDVHVGHRIGNPRAAQVCLTFDILNVPKWKTEAARAADAPAANASAKSPGWPAPPLAITGTGTAALTARSICSANPLRVPSWSIEVSRISPAPRSTASRAHSSRSRPAPRVPPCERTSHPGPRAFASMAIIALCEPASRATEVI